MRVLALDTTTEAGSLALVVEDRVVLELGGDPTSRHGERLPSDIMSLLDRCAVDLSEVDLLAVACGPGAFTGLRIGIATIQGLAFVLDRRVIGVSALEALAHLGSLDAEPGATIGAWLDARRGEVFSALYRVTGKTPFGPDRLDEMAEAAVGDPATTLARWVDGTGGLPEVFIGDGAVLHREAIRRTSPTLAGGGTPEGPEIVGSPWLAGAIGRIAVGRARRGDGVSAAALRPLYVRRPDAEIARDQQR